MLTAAFLTAFLFPVLAAAQYDNYGTTTSAATSATVAVAVPSAPANTAGFMNVSDSTLILMPENHRIFRKVDVGFQGKLVFNPANISAPVGTIVTFYFPR
jgi:plastocyanin